eukprot:CAMPEP_0169413120 /NCGR_PEP_ID=MMETSP1017-20121227/61185_1 /TAXON_ID=342587 /ORGANISM="Karlodinium micrum, Strain CCMP2283" /LENGTH=86 /DNA_ID=CAMNT_0009520511 /DNA_START=205 /DNA_END=465 /DNA_ORIENTATION=+
MMCRPFACAQGLSSWKGLGITSIQTLTPPSPLSSAAPSMLAPFNLSASQRARVNAEKLKGALSFDLLRASRYKRLSKLFVFCLQLT